jgi:indole-3-glycerol phosphate synthase
VWSFPQNSQRRQDVADARTMVSEEELQARIARMDSEHGRPLNLFERLRAEQRPMALAAEFKRASPSKGE